MDGFTESEKSEFESRFGLVKSNMALKNPCLETVHSCPEVFFTAAGSLDAGV